MSMDTIDAICASELKTIADSLKLRTVGCKFKDLRWTAKQMLDDLEKEEKEAKG